MVDKDLVKSFLLQLDEKLTLLKKTPARLRSIRLRRQEVDGGEVINVEVPKLIRRIT